MVDITEQIRQWGQYHEAPLPVSSKDSIEAPMAIPAYFALTPKKERALRDLFSIYYLEAYDKSVMGIFWKQDKDSVEKGFLANLSEKKIQYLEGKRVEETFEPDTSPRMLNFENLINLFMNAYEDDENEFFVVAEESFGLAL